MTGIRAGACLSLSGRFARFGTQAAHGLELWAEETGADLTIADDRSDPAELGRGLTSIAVEVDLLFGPYSTVLTRAAVPVAERSGRLLINHGGAGGALDLPGLVVNVLTPARRYAEPFVERLAQLQAAPLFTAAGRGTFARDVVNGAADAARSANLRVEALDQPPSGPWDLLSAGVYEDDIATVRAARALPNPPRHVGSLAAGVASFADDVSEASDGNGGNDAEGTFGIGQWASGQAGNVDHGMTETRFLTKWRDRFGGTPDYPAVQAYAAGIIASAALTRARSSSPDALWHAAKTLDIATVFGRFRLDPETGEQTGHRTVLTRWHHGRQQNQPF